MPKMQPFEHNDDKRLEMCVFFPVSLSQRVSHGKPMTKSKNRTILESGYYEM